MSMLQLFVLFLNIVSSKILSMICSETGWSVQWKLLADSTLTFEKVIDTAFIDHGGS